MIDQGGGFVLDVLRGQGVAGAIIGVLLWFIWRLLQRDDKARDELKDVLKGAAELAKNDAVVLANFTTASEARNRLSDASVRSQELSTAEIREMRADIQQLREALHARGAQ